MMQEHLFSFQRYTEDDVIYWMNVTPGTLLLYYTHFGDGSAVNVEFVRMAMKDKIPTIICKSQKGNLHWGYLSQFKKSFVSVPFNFTK